VQRAAARFAYMSPFGCDGHRVTSRASTCRLAAVVAIAVMIVIGFVIVAMLVVAESTGNFHVSWCLAEEVHVWRDVRVKSGGFSDGGRRWRSARGMTGARLRLRVRSWWRLAGRRGIADEGDACGAQSCGGVDRFARGGEVGSHRWRCWTRRFDRRPFYDMGPPPIMSQGWMASSLASGSSGGNSAWWRHRSVQGVAHMAQTGAWVHCGASSGAPDFAILQPA